MVQIKYIGSHRPKGMIVDVDEDVARSAIETGEFVEVGEKINSTTICIDEEKKPDKSWKEMEIYDWIKRENIPVTYRPASDTKKYILNELKKGGYI